MGLTYYLKFKNKLDEKKELNKIINSTNPLFLISHLSSSVFGYVEGYFNGEYIDLNLGKASFISFDVLDKEANSIMLRKSLLQTVHKICNDIYPNEDYFFDLNGDFIFEKREKGVITRNNDTDFYDNL
ncbi:hypothetical protein [uncultured Chryseobacterium sp.]|uniref:hypothetical protein n=1 Tax=uncultured Chryseobacterium sp. TaxID=259322 RepID=UPI0025E6F1AD|nr:hypothetical protein [uncultured Chryseobacterium sp.]